jgi:hypothetical protein
MNDAGCVKRLKESIYISLYDDDDDSREEKKNV